MSGDGSAAVRQADTPPGAWPQGRSAVKKLLEEQKLGVTGAIDPNSAAQLGKVLGVKIIVSGTVTSLEGYTEINARLINVDSASIIASEKVRSGSTNKLRDLVTQITEKIALAFPMYGSMVRSSTMDSLDDDSSDLSVQQDSGERRAIIPVPNWFRRE